MDFRRNWDDHGHRGYFQVSNVDRRRDRRSRSRDYREVSKTEMRSRRKNSRSKSMERQKEKFKSSSRERDSSRTRKREHFKEKEENSSEDDQKRKRSKERNISRTKKREHFKQRRENSSDDDHKDTSRTKKKDHSKDNRENSSDDDHKDTSRTKKKDHSKDNRENSSDDDHKDTSRTKKKDHSKDNRENSSDDDHKDTSRTKKKDHSKDNRENSFDDQKRPKSKDSSGKHKKRSLSKEKSSSDKHKKEYESKHEKEKVKDKSTKKVTEKIFCEDREVNQKKKGSSKDINLLEEVQRKSKRESSSPSPRRESRDREVSKYHGKKGKSKRERSLSSEASFGRHSKTMRKIEDVSEPSRKDENDYNKSLISQSKEKKKRHKSEEKDKRETKKKRRESVTDETEEKEKRETKKKRRESVTDETNLDELQMMKEKLQKELDMEEQLEKLSHTSRSKDKDKDYDYNASKYQELDNMDRRPRTSDKELDKMDRRPRTSDKELVKMDRRSRISDKEMDKMEKSRIFYKNDKTAREYDKYPDIPKKFIEDSSYKARPTMTNDTYWNKYDDKHDARMNNPKGSDRRSDGRYPNHNKDRRQSAEDESPKNQKPSSPSLSTKEQKKAPTLLIKKPVLDPLSTRTGGAYIPPAKLKMMQDEITDKSSAAFQRLSWEALKKSINGLVNKINVSNIGILVRELFRENIIRGRGVLCRALIQAQTFSPTFTHVYAALVAVINSKFPQIGELLLHRLVIQFRKGVKRNDKNSCMASCKFIAHLVNQQVSHEVVALEILTMLLEKAKDIMDETELGDKSRQSSVELSIAFLKDCGMKLSELTPKGLMIIMENLRKILHEGKLDARYKYMIEVLMAIQKENFKDFPSIVEHLDLVEEGEQFTHIIELDGKLEATDILNVFKYDPAFEENENKYQELRASILGESNDDDDSGTEGDTEDSDSNDEGSEDEEEKENKDNQILDRTEGNLIAFRRTVYLTIQSSLDVDECAHKLLKGEIKPGWEEELCNMIIDCCAQQRTYIKFYGLLAQRFCMINKIYQEPFESIFKDAYETCHRLEIEKLRNVAKLFAHLLFSDAVSWEVLSCIHLNQDETTSSSRVFLKILFEELANFMGLGKLNERLREPTISHAFEGLLPRDSPVNTRFAINFFTTIGLGGLTDDLREFLRSQPKPTAVVAPVPHAQKETSSSSTSSSSESSSSSSSDSSSSSSDSESDSSSESASSGKNSSSSSSSSDESASDSSSKNSSGSSNEASTSDDSTVKGTKNKKKNKKRKIVEVERRREISPKKSGKKKEEKTRSRSHERRRRRHENHSSKVRSHKT